MNKTKLKELKTRLQEDRDRLAIEIETIEREGHEALSEASGENNYRDHMADQGTATFSRELDMTIEDNVREAIKSVEGALHRIEEGSYGVCERCGKKISDDRLQAMPTATLCITCKSAEESR